MNHNLFIISGGAYRDRSLLSGVFQRALGPLARFESDQYTHGATGDDFGFVLRGPFNKGIPPEEVVLEGEMLFEPPQYACLFLSIRPEEFGWPNRDMGPFLSQLVLPIARELRCDLGTATPDHAGFEREEDGDEPRVIAALNQGVLPYRASAYYLSPRIVERAGLGRIRKAYEVARRRRASEMRKVGLPPDPSPEEVQESGKATSWPRPLLVEEPDGAILAYALEPGWEPLLATARP